MRNFVHFILTRFNIQIKKELDVANDICLNTEYLLKRLELFEKHTLKSIKNQTNKNFIYVVCFHYKTPNIIRKEIDRLKEIYGFYDFYFDGFFYSQFNIKKIISELGIREKTYITTRIDNDDEVDATYIDEIQKCFENIFLHAPYLISCPRGQQKKIPENKTNHWYYRQNHFFSCVSQSELDVFKFDHTTIMKQDRVPVVIIETEKPMWTQIVHESNLANRIRFNLEGEHIYIERYGFPYHLIEENDSVFLYGEKSLSKAFYNLLSVYNGFVKSVAILDDNQDDEGEGYVYMSIRDYIPSEHHIIIITEENIIEAMNKKKELLRAGIPISVVKWDGIAYNKKVYKDVYKYQVYKNKRVVHNVQQDFVWQYSKKLDYVKYDVEYDEKLIISPRESNYNFKRYNLLKNKRRYFVEILDIEADFFEFTAGVYDFYNNRELHYEQFTVVNGAKFTFDVGERMKNVAVCIYAGVAGKTNRHKMIANKIMITSVPLEEIN